MAAPVAAAAAASSSAPAAASSAPAWGQIAAQGAAGIQDYGMALLNNIATRKAVKRVMKWQEYMSNTAYQRQFADMRAAGVNPIIAMGEGATTPSAPPAVDLQMPLNSGQRVSEMIDKYNQSRLADAQVELLGQQAQTQITQQLVNNATRTKLLHDSNISIKQLDAMDATMVLQYLQGQVHSADALRIDAETLSRKFANVKAGKEADMYSGKHGTALMATEKVSALLERLNNIIFGSGKRTFYVP